MGNLSGDSREGLLVLAGLLIVLVSIVLASFMQDRKLAELQNAFEYTAAPPTYTSQTLTAM
jgi:hypothetical protein